MGKHYVIFVKKNIGIRLFALPFRGGSFLNTSNAGVFALYMNNPRSYSDQSWFSLRSVPLRGLDCMFCLFVVVRSGILSQQACSL